MGHYSSECKSGKKDDGKSSANCVSEEVDDCLICALERKMESWVLDSRASFHATSHRICSRTISPKILVRCILVTIKHATLPGKEM
jgi:hypothetical protein